MVDFTFHAVDSAPEQSRSMLKDAKDELGFCPNIFAGLAESPETLEAYLTLDKLFSNTSLSPEEQQAALLAISTENSCSYCQAAHGTMAANNTSLSQEQIDAIQEKGATGDDKLDQLVAFARALVNQRGEIKEDQLERFIKSGYTQRNVLELVLATSMKTISNYSNHIMKTPVDKPFRDQMHDAA